jgi:hypothetical protein
MDDVIEWLFGDGCLTLLGGIVAATVLGVGMAKMGGVNPTYSEGNWSGQVTKLSYKGVIWKSWEGELVAGGMRSQSTKEGTTAVANVMEFNADPSVVPALNAAVVSGKRVRLTYHQWLLCPWRIENDHVITSVTEEP